MSAYEVAGHLIDHPPLFACRTHKSILGLNRPFIEELLAWAPDMPTRNLTDVAADCLDGDNRAFATSEYLIPPKVMVFNPRKIQGAGALPFLVVLVDTKFYGIPSSYLRRRIFDGCPECAKENDPASDSSFEDYKAPPKKVAPAPAPARPKTTAVARPPASGTAPKPAGAPPKPAPAAPGTPRSPTPSGGVQTTPPPSVQTRMVAKPANTPPATTKRQAAPKPPEA